MQVDRYDSRAAARLHDLQSRDAAQQVDSGDGILQFDLGLVDHGGGTRHLIADFLDAGSGDDDLVQLVGVGVGGAGLGSSQDHGAGRGERHPAPRGVAHGVTPDSRKEGGSCLGVMCTH